MRTKMLVGALVAAGVIGGGAVTWRDHFHAPISEANAAGAPSTGVAAPAANPGATTLPLNGFTDLVKKYGLEGSDPLDKDIHILNGAPAPEQPPPQEVWDAKDPTLPLPSRQRRKGDEIPMASIEIPLPDGYDALPDIGGAPAAVQQRELVKEVTVPLTLTQEEARRGRKLRLKWTVDITIE